MFNKQLRWICIYNYFRILVDDQEIFRLNTPWNGMYNYCPYHNIEDPWRNGPHNAPFDQPVRLPILWKWHILLVFFLIIFSYNVPLLRVGIKDRFTTCQIINIMYLRLNPFANQIIGILSVLEDVNDDTCGTWNILSQYVAKSLWYPLVVPSHFERGCWWDRGFLQWRTVWCSQVLA